MRAAYALEGDGGEDAGENAVGGGRRTRRSQIFRLFGRDKIHVY